MFEQLYLMTSDTQVLVCGDCFMDRRVCTARTHNPPNNHQRGGQFTTLKKLTLINHSDSQCLHWPGPGGHVNVDAKDRIGGELAQRVRRGLQHEGSPAQDQDDHGCGAPSQL